MNEAMAECGPGEERFDMLWVPRGSLPSAEWLAAHPGWVKFPAVMVPRNADGSRRPWAEIQRLLRETDATWGTGAEPLPSPPTDAGATPLGGAVEPADPVGAYLRMAKVFDHPAASAGVAPAASKPPTQPPRQYADAAQIGSRTDAAPEATQPPTQRVNAAAGAADGTSRGTNGAGGLPDPSHVNNISTVISQTIAGSERSSYFRYYQNNGQLYIVNGTTGDSAYIATGYSGAPGHVNDGLAENRQNIGPITTGYWYIGDMVRHGGHMGPNVLPLTPSEHTDTFGRTAFYMHGDIVTKPGTASQGCIILDAASRSAISSSKIHRLQVYQGGGN